MLIRLGRKLKIIVTVNRPVGNRLFRRERYAPNRSRRYSGTTAFMDTLGFLRPVCRVAVCVFGPDSKMQNPAVQERGLQIHPEQKGGILYEFPDAVTASVVTKEASD